MLDFMSVCVSTGRNGIEIYPKFIVKKTKDLMIQGGDFYAVWCEEKGLWSTDEDDVRIMVDHELDTVAEKYKETENTVKIRHMWDSDSGVIDKWHKYCQRQLRDSFKPLDETLTFSNTEVKKTDYVSKRLPYPLEKGEPTAWNSLIGVLYSPEEKHKIEWIIGAIVSGDSKKMQKFAVLYGAMGTGKSTVIDIIEWLFEGYYGVFDAKALGSSSDQFALESFRDNPLVAIQHDGDLSRIEDNTRLNSLVSHEKMRVSEKYKKTYSNAFKSFLIMGTNKPVKITDAKSGLIRRLIDISPSGNKVPRREYDRLKAQIKFELGKIATYCLDIYKDDPNYYDDYVPVKMMGASNDFYNFVDDQFLYFQKEKDITLKSAWELYKNWCDDAKITFPFSLRIFKEELKNYFTEFRDRHTLDDGTRVRNLYLGFKDEKFKTDKEFGETKEKAKAKKHSSWINLKEQPSVLDDIFGDFPAQYANDSGKPRHRWTNVKTKLKDISTNELHYVLTPKDTTYIFIDFDIRDENGNKSLEKNLEAASKFPKTYAEVSQGGQGLHLHYIYDGDRSELSSIYSDGIEVKTCIGDSPIRRRLSLCNNLPVAHIATGLPLKEVKKVEDFRIKNEQHLRSIIRKCLNKEIHPDTTSNVNFIASLLHDAYESGVPYDVSDLRNAICAFAAGSTNQAENCLKTVLKMEFKSMEDSPPPQIEEAEIVFFDVEVFKNLFVVCWKKRGKDNPVVKMINPRPVDIEKILRYRLVGFNNRKYDNHILYARLMGYSNEALYELSHSIVSGVQKDCFFSDAYGISYTDVYDFCSEKKGLKKWEIELGLYHVELSFSWDEPVSESLWNTVADYCANDVIATEAVFEHRYSDFIAREILADLSGLTVNDTNNQHTTRIIFGGNRNPQSEFNYRFMGIPTSEVNGCLEVPGMDCNWAYTVFKDGKPWFPGYTFTKDDKGHWVSAYRGKEVGEGGYVYAEPGMYENVALLDIASMHPSSIIAENLFGDTYTAKFKQIKDIRIYIKHKEFDKVREMFDGKLAKYLTDAKSAKALSNALKIPINSVYGLTAARFSNAFRDPRNTDNIVAKRGALFMVNLLYEVQARGFTVAHIKTDSIKIPNATPEIIKFVNDYGKMYGYDFEHEATYEKMTLVNDAVYIAHYLDPEECKKLYGYIPEKNAAKDKLIEEGKWHDGWTATGKQFAVPYVFKTLFSHEAIEFGDKCETINVTNSALYLDMNDNYVDVTAQEKELEKIRKVKMIDGTKVDYMSPKAHLTDEERAEIQEKVDILTESISHGHNYQFVGRVGLFTPVVKGGGDLLRKTDTGYAFAAGTKGYRWLDASIAKDSNNIEIDISYYRKLVDDAVDTIRETRKKQLEKELPYEPDDNQVENDVRAFIPV